jgi:RNA polymerase sigma-70 factor, ECF subfamily
MHISETELKDIIVLAKKGRLDAFEKIVSFYERGVFSYIYSSVSHVQDAEDLTQETFIRLYKNLNSIDTDKNFKAWLYKIGMNVMYDWFRKKNRRQELFLIDDETHQFETIDEKDPYWLVENAQQLESALSKLKPTQKQILLLFYYQGFSYEEIVAILSIPLNTVKTNLRRAKQALGDILQNPYV